MAVTLRVSTSKYLKSAINCAEWHLPQITTKIFWSLHQAGSLVILGHMVNMSSELEVAGLERTARNFMEKLLERLGVEGRVSADAVAKRLPPIFFSVSSMWYQEEDQRNKS